MTRSAILLLLAVSFIDERSEAQSGSEQREQPRELLTLLSDEHQTYLKKLDRLEFASHEYFAKQGSIGIYSFDIGSLQAVGEIITITLDGREPIVLRSKGIERNPDWRGAHSIWHGEVLAPAGEDFIPAKFRSVELRIATRSVDADGNVRMPDPNREVTLSELASGSSVVLWESYLRRDEKLVHTIAGNFIRVPGMDATLAFHMTGGSFDGDVVYEVDPSKTVPADDVVLDDANREVGGEDPRQSLAAEMRSRRQAAYEAYMERKAQEFSSNDFQGASRE